MEQTAADSRVKKFAVSIRDTRLLIVAGYGSVTFMPLKIW